MKTPAEMIERIISREVKRLPAGRPADKYARNRAESLWSVYQERGREGLFYYLERG